VHGLRNDVIVFSYYYFIDEEVKNKESFMDLNKICQTILMLGISQVIEMKDDH
jgi:hypothetical protein